jgi:hypothetical protein
VKGSEREGEGAYVKPWQMTVESGRRRRLGTLWSYRLRFFRGAEVASPRRGAERGGGGASGSVEGTGKEGKGRTDREREGNEQRA